MKKGPKRQTGPSRASLREIPEVDFKIARVTRNPFVDRVASGGIVHVGQGKPKTGEQAAKRR